MTRPKLQFVWPKDGPRGRNGHRGFWGRMNNILTNRGPDVYLQRKGSSTAIKPDQWANWDSYHHRASHQREEGDPFVSRGTKRYDPHTRRYVTWTIPHDWYGVYDRPDGSANYLRFTRDEWRKMRRQFWRRGLVDPSTMGPDWHHEGPRRFAQEYDYFWQNAHRTGENRREGYHHTSGINPWLRMHQNDIYDFDEWVLEESRR